MNYSIKIGILGLLILTVSCSCFKETPFPENGLKITQKNLHQLNGKYKRMAISSQLKKDDYNFNDSFECFFQGTDKTLRDTTTLENDFLSLKLLNNNRLRVSLIKNNSTIYSKIVRGKIINNRFVLKRRVYVLPFIILNFIDNRNTRITLMENDNIQLDTFIDDFANFLIFPATAYYEGYGIEFQKVIDKPNIDFYQQRTLHRLDW